VYDDKEIIERLNVRIAPEEIMLTHSYIPRNAQMTTYPKIALLLPRSSAIIPLGGMVIYNLYGKGRRKMRERGEGRR
jgi:hypothetical protein